METNRRSIETLRLVGGQCCLDFTNTLDARSSNHPYEYLHSYAELIKWYHYVRLLSEETTQRLLEEEKERPHATLEGYQEALAFRETLYRIFSAKAGGAIPAVADLAALSTTYTVALSHARLVPSGEEFIWKWGGDERRRQDNYPIWRLAQSAIDLLTSPNIHRVKECPGNKGCGWLFLDTSKNGSRHWCSMEGCGSRVKRHRQYRRQRHLS